MPADEWWELQKSVTDAVVSLAQHCKFQQSLSGQDCADVQQDDLRLSISAPRMILSLLKNTALHIRRRTLRTLVVLAQYGEYLSNTTRLLRY